VLESETGCLVHSQFQRCGEPEYRQELQVMHDGTTGVLTTTILNGPNCSIGRRPNGLRAAPSAQLGALARFFARAAHLEAASVYAFGQVARELVLHAAPAALVAFAQRSALDEVRHAQLTAAQARRFGAVPAAPQVLASGERSLLAFALDNAVEGCVRETYGALLAHHQAALAQDSQVALLMRGIAEDETRHAELSFRIARWAEPQLTAAERVLIAAAQYAALLELRAGVARDAPTADAARVLGWPDASVEHALIGRLASVLGFVV
jgi:hypothetical protein